MDSSDRFIHEKVFDLIARGNIASVCDYGCGEGLLLARLAREKRVIGPLVGIDVFSEFCCDRLTPEPGVKYVDREKDEFTRLLGQRRFDLVLSSQTLHHFRTPIRELKNIWELTRPGGKALLIDVHFSQKSERQVAKDLYAFITEAYSLFKGSHHRHHYTLDEALDLVGALPFRVLEAKMIDLNPTPEESAEIAQTMIEHLGQKRAEKLFESTVLNGFFQMAFANLQEAVSTVGIEYSSMISILLERPEER